MFGFHNNTPVAPVRPAASDVAEIEATYTQIIVGADVNAGISVFVNGEALPEGDLDSITIEVLAPGAGSAVGGISAVLSRYAASPTGQRTQHAQILFPGTIELVARGRRIVVSARDAQSVESVWLGLGMRADGTSSELTGVQSLRIAVAPALLDAKLVWADTGASEDLLPG